MKIYTKKITVTEDDLDELHHVNNVRYVEWVQEIAREHWEALAEADIRLNYFWVMLSHFIEYKGEAVLGESISLKTYVLHTEGVFSTRMVEMFLNTSEKLIVRSETKWCLINAETKKPARIPKNIFAIFH